MIIRYFLFVLAISLYACVTTDTRNDSGEFVEDADSLVTEISIVGEEITYTTDTTSMKGYLSYDETITEKRPGILVVHEWWGHTDYVRERADMLAELGYVAFALDMYGNGRTAEHPDNAKQFSSKVMKDLEMAESRFEAAVEVLKNHPAVDSTRISAVGYCFGGSLALTMANMGMDLDGVAAFHSGVQLPVAPNDRLRAAVLVQNGAKDPFISELSVSNFTSQLDSLGADYEYIEYPDAVHAYTNPGADELGKEFDLPLAYDPEADMKSWDKLKSFLNELYTKD
jgi:dienelactone hydrolase